MMLKSSLRLMVAVTLVCSLPMAAANAATYVELLSQSQLNGGNAALANQTMTVVDGNTAYTHMAKTTTPQDFAINKVTDIGGTPVTSGLSTLASWSGDVGAPDGSRIFTGYGSAIVGNSLQIVNSNNGAGEGVFRINTTTGTVSTYLTEADITAVTGQANPDIQNWSGVSPTGEAVFYEGADDIILQTNGAGSVVTLVTNAELLLAQGSTDMGSGLTYDAAGNLFWGNSTSDAIYRRAGDGTISTFVTQADLDAVVGAGSNSFAGDMFYAPDGLIYFRFGSTSTRSILSFDPMAADPGASVATLLSSADLLAGPAASSSVMHMSWYDGNLTFTTSGGGLYAVPEPSSLLLIGLGSLLLIRRRR